MHEVVAVRLSDLLGKLKIITIFMILLWLTTLQTRHRVFREVEYPNYLIMAIIMNCDNNVN